mmetsp:Transcript_26793/g.75150  ORF Transcript_26793/g.75150 Transcript_26793/m.75150 type:complete len:287 (-) Transcript_26793:67-927(-)
MLVMGIMGVVTMITVWTDRHACGRRSSKGARLRSRRLGGCLLEVLLLVMALRPTLSVLGELVGCIAANRAPQDESNRSCDQRSHNDASAHSRDRLGLALLLHRILLRMHRVGARGVAGSRHRHVALLAGVVAHHGAARRSDAAGPLLRGGGILLEALEGGLLRPHHVLGHAADGEALIVLRGRGRDDRRLRELRVEQHVVGGGGGRSHGRRHRRVAVLRRRLRRHRLRLRECGRGSERIRLHLVVGVRGRAARGRRLACARCREGVEAAGHGGVGGGGRHCVCVRV